jgi:malonyl-CoA/methylmalonyl-CoA synthetase
MTDEAQGTANHGSTSPGSTSPGSTVDQDLLREGTLPAAWVRHWRAQPDRAVFREPGGRWITGRELDERSRDAALGFWAAGLRPGDRIVMSCVASAELIIDHCAAMRAGFVVVPANTAYTGRELAHIVGDSGARMVIGDADVREALTDQFHHVTVTGPGVAVRDATGVGDDPIVLDRVSSNDIALIGYTSGTTGAPKGAVLTHANLLAGAEALRRAWQWTADDRLVLCLPLFHMHGLGVGLHGTLLAGASAVLQRGFDIDRVLTASRDATMFFGVPTMYERLVRHGDPSAMSNLRLCVSGSAPLPAELHERFKALTGQRVLERYGMTETVMLVSNPYDGARRAGTVGLPLPGVELKLGDQDEIWVRGPNVFTQYWNKPEASAAAFTDGWFRTGDVGSLDEAGYLRIVGRTKELIISGGFNVYPREIEDVLRSHPGVRDAAVVGTPDPEWGEIVTAYIESDDDLDLDGLDALAKRELAAFKRPRRWHRVDALPRNALGKVMRHHLGAD